jgi:citronellol/citronellal dehydrogenase
VPLAQDFFVPDDDVAPPGVTVTRLATTGGVQKSG